jgi:hypothetical protein
LADALGAVDVVPAVELEQEASTTARMMKPIDLVVTMV